MLRGTVGAIKWHDYNAAAINGYEVTRTPTGSYALVGTVVLKDAFKLSQRPLLFVAPHKDGSWRWPLIDFTIHDSGRLTARLGPMI